MRNINHRNHLLITMAALVPSWATGFATADTPVGGPIVSDTTWTAAGSPYIVSQSIIIGVNSTLTIEPGVVVRIAPGLTITVGSNAFGPGGLEVLGAEDDPVVFESTMPGGPRWERLYFTDFALDAQYDEETGDYVDGARISHAIVRDAGDGSDEAIRIENCQVLLEACDVFNTDGRALTVTLQAGQELRLLDSRIEGNGFQQNSFDGGGLHLQGGADHQICGNVWVENFTNGSSADGGAIYMQNTTDAYFCDNVFDGNSTLVSNAGGGAAYLTSCPGFVWQGGTIANSIAGGNGGAVWVQSSAGALFDNVTFNGNRSDFGDGGAAYVSSSTGLTFANCQFIDNETGQSSRDGGGLFASSCASLSIEGCTFTENVARDEGGALFITSCQDLAMIGTAITANSADDRGGAVYFSNSDNATIDDCTIAGNTSVNDGAGLYIDTNSESWTIRNTEISGNVTALAGKLGGGAYVGSGGFPSAFINCRIENNEAPEGSGGGIFIAASAMNQAGETVSLAGDPDDDEFNVICSNVADFGANLYNAAPFAPDGSGDIDATNVCWCTNDFLAVQTGIWDFFDDGDLGIVITFPLAECACLGDIDGDAEVGASDLALLLGAWGTDDSAADLDASGQVDAGDLALLLGAWGDCN